MTTDGFRGRDLSRQNWRIDTISCAIWPFLA